MLSLTVMDIFIVKCFREKEGAAIEAAPSSEELHLLGSYNWGSGLARKLAHLATQLRDSAGFENHIALTTGFTLIPERTVQKCHSEGQTRPIFTYVYLEISTI